MSSFRQAESGLLAPLKLGAMALMGRSLTIVTLAALLLPACSTSAPTGRRDVDKTYDQESIDQEATNGSDVPEELPGKYATFDPAVTNPEKYIGQTVVISGRVRTVYGDSGFLIQDEETATPLQDKEMAAPEQQNSAQNQGVLVLVPNAATNGVSLPQVGDYLQLTGEVSRFEPISLEQQYGFTWDTELRSQLEAAYASRPIIIAQAN